MSQQQQQQQRKHQRSKPYEKLLPSCTSVHMRVYMVWLSTKSSFNNYTFLYTWVMGVHDYYMGH